jgi:hypothetical protein
MIGATGGVSASLQGDFRPSNTTASSAKESFSVGDESDWYGHCRKLLASPSNLTGLSRDTRLACASECILGGGFRGSLSQVLVLVRLDAKPGLSCGRTI